MHKRNKFLLLFVLGLIMLLTACINSTENTEEVADIETATDAPPTATLPSPTATTVPVDYCISCHTDVDRLTNTADTEQDVISENEGEG